MNLFYQPLLPSGTFMLDPEESKHCVKVLRKRTGDVIHITDGLGYFYQGRIIEADVRACRFEVISKEREQQRSFTIHLAISPTKNPERLEWFVEKCVEIGVDRISLVECHHTERSFIKHERLHKIAVSAMKQSLKASVPLITPLMRFREVVESCADAEKFIAHVDATNPHQLKERASVNTSYCVLIGPEGDFTTEELAFAAEQGFTKVSLGRSRLRTETAGIVACLTLSLINP